VTVSTAALDRAYEESGIYLGRIWATHRDVPVDDHIRAILAAIDPGLLKRVPPALLNALIEAYSRPILVVPPTVDDTALAALESLNVGGYTLALISNVMRTPGVSLRRMLERFRLLRYFQHTTFSDEVRIRKPAPEIFHLTLRAVAGEPKSSVHVGDDPILDVQGAHAAGMRVIQVTSSSAARGPRPDLTISRLAELPEAIEQLES
jgi:putative hydrolase of the HAD superfamily